MVIKTSDIQAVGLILISIMLFFFSLALTNNLLKLSGLIGSLLVFIAEVVFIYQTKIKKWLN